MVSGNLSDSLFFCGEFISHNFKSNFRLVKISTPCQEISTGMAGRGIDVIGLLLPHQEGLDPILGDLDQEGIGDLAQGGQGDLAQGGQGDLTEGLHRQGFQSMF